MSDPADRWEEQAVGIRLIPDFEAMPRTGPGRWCEPYDGVILYTNDDNILFATEITEEADEAGTGTLLRRALDKAFGAGETATAAFERLRNGAEVTEGDLSEMSLK